MIAVRRAVLQDVQAISQVCSAGWRDTYRQLHSPEHIEYIVGKYYAPQRLALEVASPEHWDGWLVALEDEEIIGAGGGGVTGPNQWEIFVLYLDPLKRRRGAGTALVKAMTEQATAHQAQEQWVSATQNNVKGLPFYESLGFVVREEKISASTVTGEPIKTFRMSRPLAVETP